MRLHKTDDLTIKINIADIPPNPTVKETVLISVAIGEAEPITMQVSKRLIKSQITDNTFVRNIFNFLVKE